MNSTTRRPRVGYMGAAVRVRNDIFMREGLNKLHGCFLGFLFLFFGAFTGAAQLVVIRQGGESVAIGGLDELWAVFGHQLGGVSGKVVGEV